MPPATLRPASATSVDLIVDGGQLTEVPSTLVNVRGPGAAVEREGVILRDEIERTLAVLS